MAAIDEFGEQVILIGRLEVDRLAPRRVAQPRPLGLAVVGEPLEPVAGEACEEAIPFGAVEIVNLAIAESLDDPPRILELVAKVVPRLTMQQSVTPRLGHRSTPTSARTPNRSV